LRCRTSSSSATRSPCPSAAASARATLRDPREPRCVRPAPAPPASVCSRGKGRRAARGASATGRRACRAGTRGAATATADASAAREERRRRPLSGCRRAAEAGEPAQAGPSQGIEVRVARWRQS
jgi:hypothetical protein